MKSVTSFTALCIAATLFAADAVHIPRMSMELADAIAKRAVLACRDKGYQVSAVVVDRSANVQAALRDTFAARFTLEIAERKANLVIMSGRPTGEFVAARGDIRAELNHIDGLIMMTGGLPVKSGDTVLGAVGVSGAPGGEKDEACAQKALAELDERLAMALFGEDDE